MAVNWVHVTNAESNGSDDITIPAGASAGDVAFLFDTAASFGGAPSKVVPTGFDEIVSFAGTTIARTTVSVRILEAGDPGSIITGQSGDALEVKNMVVVSSDEDAIQGIAIRSLNSEATDSDPAQQTVTGSDEFVVDGLPIVTFANWAAGNAITTDSFSPARDAELDNAGTDQITAWRFDNLDGFGDPTAQDTTVDMDDEGTNALVSFYVVPTIPIPASGSPQADDASATGSAKATAAATGSPQADDASVSASFPITFIQEGRLSPLVTVDRNSTATYWGIAVSGGPQADDATGDGDALAKNAAQGSPQADDATGDGDAFAKNAAAGSPQADDATSSGNAEAKITASGSPQADDATAAGVADVYEFELIEEDRRILTVVEIDYDFCNLVYSNAPCAAVLGTTGDVKCFNTRITCQDPDNYDRGIKVLRFVEPCGFEPLTLDAIPSILSVSTAAARIHPGEDLGERANVSITFQDHLHHDRGLDKYAAERITGAALASGVGYDPNKRGTFWGKFRARNPFYRFRNLRVIQGTIAEYEADPVNLSAMETRHYVMDSISGPTSDGQFTITAKDVLKLADDDRAQAPRASKGELSADITDVATSFTLSPTGIGDDEYPASGWVVVGNEVMSFTRTGDDMTVTRGDYGTAAEEHSDGDTVQLAIEYDSQKASAIVEDLLVNYADVPAGFIPTADWTAEDDTHINRVYTALIAEPTAVNELIGQMNRQVGFTVWWNEVEQLIEFKAIRQPSVTPLTLNDDKHFLAGSVRVKEQQKKRISQVWAYYGVVDPTEDVEQARNYRSVFVAVDADAESPDEYDKPQIKKIFARWIDRFNKPAAEDMANRMLSRFRDPPRQIDFSLPWDQEDVHLGNAYDLRTRTIQGADGAADTRRILVKSYERGEKQANVESEEFLFLPDPDDDIHRIVIDANTTSMADGSPFNLREAHDNIYPNVTGDDTVELIVEDGVILGGEDTAFPACDIGDWPENPTIKVIVHGRIQGPGGDGGPSGPGSGEGTDGEDGGTALYTRIAIELDNQNEVWSGGGGGTGVNQGGGIGIFPGRGGGGAGFVPGDGNGGYPDTPSLRGTEATTEEGGAGSGSASNGGDPGQDGEGGALGGVSGNAGAAIDGDSFVTYTTVGDIRGPQIN